MIIYATKEQREEDPRMPCQAYRKAFQVSLWDKNGTKGFFVEWGPQHKFRDSTEWRTHHAVGRWFSVTNHFKWGGEHFYYDGPHCMFSVGFLHFGWSNWECKECLGDK